MIRILTYHGSSSKISRILSHFQEKAGYWDDNVVHELKTQLDKAEKEYPLYIPAPSHVLCQIGKNDFVEADWGQAVFPLFPWWRKNCGVRRFRTKQLRQRSGFHIVWEIESTEVEFKRFRDGLIDASSWRVGYDFLGLLGAAGMVLCKRDFSRIHDEGKLFCSETTTSFVSDAIQTLPRYNGKKVFAHYVNPAMSPQVFHFKAVDIIYPTV